jgi:hypothetical protein
MKFDISQINFSQGKIEFNDLDLNVSEPLINQLDNLKEDLLQVSYANGLLLDVGWYPSFDENGEFQIRVIENNNWDEPVYSSETNSIDGLISAIRNAVSNCLKE